MTSAIAEAEAKGSAEPEPRFYRIQWGLCNEWWCVAEDLSEEEQVQMCLSIRENLGTDFNDCPTEYIRDRLYGGFPCGNGPHRRHVCFATARYSFIGASEGHYEPNRCRAEDWAHLDSVETHPWIGGGPFSEREAAPPITGADHTTEDAMKLHVAKQDDGFYQVSLTHGEDAPDGPTRTGVAVMSDVGLSIVTKLAEAAGIHADCGTTADPNA